MAQITKSGLSGAIGPMVYYSMNGKNYVRSKPGPRGRQFKNKIKAVTGLFSKVSSMSTRMATKLRTELSCPFGLYAYNTFRGWMLRQFRNDPDRIDWPLSIIPDEQCQLNKAADLREFIRVGMSVTDKGEDGMTVTVDAFNPLKDIKAPAGAESVNLKLICTALRGPAGGNSTELAMAQYAVNLHDKTIPAFEMELNTRAEKGDFLCLVFALEFRAGRKHTSGIMSNPEFLPAAGVAFGRKG